VEEQHLVDRDLEVQELYLVLEVLLVEQVEYLEELI
jgi:hypothetical protein